MHAYTCMHIPIQTDRQTDRHITQTSILVYRSILVFADIQTYVYPYIHTYTYTYMVLHIYVHTYMHQGVSRFPENNNNSRTNLFQNNCWETFVQWWISLLNLVLIHWRWLILEIDMEFYLFCNGGSSGNTCITLYVDLYCFMMLL